MNTVNIKTDDFSHYKDSVHTFLYALAVKIKPLLCSVDEEKLSTTSRFNLDLDKQELNVFIEAENMNIPFICLFASTKQYILGYADSEQIENHALEKSRDINDEVNILYEHIERYLNGITIIEHFNKKNILIRKEYFWGLDTRKEKKFGEMKMFSLSGLLFPAEHKKAVYSFKFTK